MFIFIAAMGMNHALILELGYESCVDFRIDVSPFTDTIFYCQVLFWKLQMLKKPLDFALKLQV